MMDAIYRFFGSILQFLDNLTGSYMAALALFALIIQLALLPLAIKQQKNSIKQASLAPKVAAIRNKYKGRDDQTTRQKVQNETMELYQKEGFNPAGGCLPLLIQMPIILVLYQVIIKPISYVVGLSADAYSAVTSRLVEIGLYAEGTDFAKISEIEVIGKMHEAISSNSEVFSAVSELSGKTLPNFKIGLFDLAVSPQLSINPSDGVWQWNWLILVPILTVVLMYLTTKITRKFTYQPPETADAQNNMSMKIMNLAMPLFSAYIAYIWPAAIGIYWIIRNIYQVIQQIVIAKLMPPPQFTEEDYRAAERELRGKSKDKKVQKSENAGKVRSLHHIDDDDDDLPPPPPKKAPEAKADPRIEAAPLKEEDEPKNDND